MNKFRESINRAGNLVINGMLVIAVVFLILAIGQWYLYGDVEVLIFAIAFLLVALSFVIIRKLISKDDKK
jgi:amino acid transporter